MARLSFLAFASVLLLLLSFPTPTSAFFLFQWLFGGGDDSCADIASVNNFDLSAFIARSWYIQRQQVNTYQSPDRLFCVVATYDEEGKSQWFQPAITVRNFSAGKNNASPSSTELCATKTDRDGQLRVAPCFLPSFFGGPYWAVATDYNTYAIVTGGKLTTPGSCKDDAGELCTTPDEGSIFDPLSFVGNNQGLWFFTRDRMPSAAVMTMLEDKAAELGICTTDMLPVVQAGCDYIGAQIK
jgi:hypothetical protein